MKERTLLMLPQNRSPKKAFDLKLKVDKAIQLEAWTGPEVSSSLRLPNFKTIDTRRG
jgi:hypothetical protein